MSDSGTGRLIAVALVDAASIFGLDDTDRRTTGVNGGDRRRRLNAP
jgi:hypothetical protein